MIRSVPGRDRIFGVFKFKETPDRKDRLLNTKNKIMSSPQPAAVLRASCSDRVCNFSHNPEGAPQRTSLALAAQRSMHLGGVWGNWFPQILLKSASEAQRIKKRRAVEKL
jgi:hypothetical protein